MNRISFFLFLCLITIIYSCQKNSLNGTPYHSTYNKSGIIPANSFRLFTSKGEITDQFLVDRFNGADSSRFNNIAAYIANEQGFMDSIVFIDEQNASVFNYSSGVGCKVNYNDALFILSESNINTGYSNGDVFTKTIYYFIGQIKYEVYTEYLVSSTRGNYYFNFTGRFKHVLKRKGGHMIAPMVQFQTHQDLINYGSAGIVNNILQEDFYTKLTVGDTVALREYNLLYEKR